jgi:hypothetical protein
MIGEPMDPDTLKDGEKVVAARLYHCYQAHLVHNTTTLIAFQILHTLT